MPGKEQLLLQAKTTSVRETLGFLSDQGVTSATIRVQLGARSADVEVPVPAELGLPNLMTIARRLAARPSTARSALVEVRRSGDRTDGSPLERRELGSWTDCGHAIDPAGGTLTARQAAATDENRDTEIIAATFVVTALAEPQVALRVLNLLAQRDLLPTSAKLERRADELTIIIEQHGITRASAMLIAEKMRALVTVLRVDLHLASSSSGARWNAEQC